MSDGCGGTGDIALHDFRARAGDSVMRCARCSVERDCEAVAYALQAALTECRTLVRAVRDKLYVVRGSAAMGRLDYADNSAKEALELMRAGGHLEPVYIATEQP